MDLSSTNLLSKLSLQNFEALAAAYKIFLLRLIHFEVSEGSGKGGDEMEEHENVDKIVRPFYRARQIIL